MAVPPPVPPSGLPNTPYHNERNIFQQPGIHGQAVAFSPYHSHLLATVGAQYYGIAGCGQLSILHQTPAGLQEVQRLEWSDGLFDCCWSEQNEHHIVSASGDGSIQLWDLGAVPRGINQGERSGPVKVFRGHTKEAVSVEWNLTRGCSNFVSGSWDGTVMLWDPLSVSGEPLTICREHLSMVYCTKWAPRKPDIFASCSGDCTLKIWDARAPAHSVQSHKPHDYEILSCDWNKYDENIIVTGSIDKTLRGFDMRVGPGAPPLFVLQGHTYAVRQVRYSPFEPNIVASCSYDFTVRLWDTARPPGQQQIRVFSDHTEFVIGLAYSTHQPGVLADCSWDESVVVRTLS